MSKENGKFTEEPEVIVAESDVIEVPAEVDASQDAPSPDFSKVNEVVTGSIQGKVTQAADGIFTVEAAAVTTEEVLKKEVEHWKDYARRAQAEFENARKRLAASHQEEVKRAGIRITESIIPVIDDIEYAMAHADETANEMKDGLVAIHTKLMAALQREGVEVFDPQGQPFDSETAQAVSLVQTADIPADTVVEVIQKGYRLGGKTLRPAMVTVSSGA